uniref:Transcription initiation factor TFIID subunit 8 n=1 Tax=Panagrellus redivivus TaxID=6233 RepID=A0A7E4VDL6_PANRE
MYTLPNDRYTLHLLKNASIATAKSVGFDDINEDVTNYVANYAFDYALRSCRRASRHASYLHRRLSIDDLEFAGIDLEALRHFADNVPSMGAAPVPKYPVKPKVDFINQLNIPGLPPHAIECLKDMNLYVEPQATKAADKNDDDEDMLLEALKSQERESRIVWPDNPGKKYPSLRSLPPVDLNASPLEDPFLRRLYLPRVQVDDMALAVQAPEAFYRAEHQKALASRTGPNYNWADNASSSDEDIGFSQKTVVPSPSDDAIAVAPLPVPKPVEPVTPYRPRKSPGFVRKYPLRDGVPGRGTYKTKRMDPTGSGWVTRPHAVKGNVITLKDGTEVFVGDLTPDEIRETNTEIVVRTSKTRKHEPIKLRLCPPK